MNSKLVKQGGSIYDTLYIAQVSRGPKDQSSRGVPTQSSVYDASRARFSRTSTANQSSAKVPPGADKEG